MNKELFKKNICEPLAEMTERNDHSNAVVFVAEYLNGRINGSFAPETERGQEAADLCKWAKYIRDEHHRIGHLHEPLLNFRNSVLHICLCRLYDIIGEDCLNEMNKCL